jgi:hypothetical protein
LSEKDLFMASSLPEMEQHVHLYDDCCLVACAALLMPSTTINSFSEPRSNKMSHHFPDVKPLRTVPIIITRKRLPQSWIAFLADEADAWKTGATEAIGLLLLTHSDRLGVQLHREEARSSQSKKL